MQTSRTSRIVLALLGIAFLLLNPAGICAGTPGTQSPSHPCCPKPSAPAQAPVTSSCVCIDRAPAAPALPSLTDSGLVAVIVPDTAAVEAVALPTLDFAAIDVPLEVAQDLPVSFRQLLL